MKYFFDTEFLEGTQVRRFCGVPVGMTKNTIDLISIGIVSEDGREYYGISKDFNLREAWDRYDTIKGSGYDTDYPEASLPDRKVYWVRENVLKPIYYDLIGKDINFHDYDRFFTYKSFKKLIDKYGKTNKQIAEEIKRFVYNPESVRPMGTEEPIEFYAYYADYDWVVFCWLFGKMIDLPKGFPMYCRDLKQDYDLLNSSFELAISKNQAGNLDKSIKCLKDFRDYPQETNAHNALADARWGFELYKFLKKL